MGKDMRSQEGRGGEEAQILNVPLPLDCSPQTTTPRRLPPCSASSPLDRPITLAAAGRAASAVALPEFLNHRRKEGKKEEIKIWKDSSVRTLGSLLTAGVPRDVVGRSVGLGRLGARRNEVGMHTYSRSYPFNQPTPRGGKDGHKNVFLIHSFEPLAAGNIFIRLGR